MLREKFIFAIFLNIFINSGEMKIPRHRIFGGEAAKPGEFPYAALIEDSVYTWAGIIVSIRHVMSTAADLINYTSPYKDLSVYTGSIEIFYGIKHSVKSVTLHPKFIKSANQHYNVGIIMLCKLMEFNQNQQPVKLPTSEVRDGDKAIVIGWGLVGPNQNENILQKLTRTVYGVDLCNNTDDIGPFYDKARICTIDKKGAGLCGGDGGNPLIVNGVLVGLGTILKGHDCVDGKDIYVSVYECMDYVEKEINTQVCRAYSPGTTVMARMEDEY